MRPPRAIMPARRGSLLALGAVSAAAALAGIGASWWRSGRGAAASSLAPLLAQAFEDPEGAPHKLADWQDRVLLVNFWATWCPPCVAEMPALQHIFEEYAGRGAMVVGVGIDTAQRIRAFRDQYKIAFPLLVAGSGGNDLGRALGNDNGVLPYTVMVLGGARIARQHIGALVADEVRTWLDEAIRA